MDIVFPEVNFAFARQKFQRLQQKEGKTVLQFVTRLRKEGKDCNFGADFGNQLSDAGKDCNFGADFDNQLSDAALLQM